MGIYKDSPPIAAVPKIQLQPTPIPLSIQTAIPQQMLLKGTALSFCCLSLLTCPQCWLKLSLLQGSGRLVPPVLDPSPKPLLQAPSWVQAHVPSQGSHPSQPEAERAPEMMFPRTPGCDCNQCGLGGRAGSDVCWRDTECSGSADSKDRMHRKHPEVSPTPSPSALAAPRALLPGMPHAEVPWHLGDLPYFICLCNCNCICSPVWHPKHTPSSPGKGAVSRQLH